MNRFYFDHNATTPIAPEVLQSHVQALQEVYGNASSIHHQGQLAKQRLESSRKLLADRLHCDAKELVFLSGGTEANNTAIFGSIARSAKREHYPGHVITTAIEHPSVLNACAKLERQGVEVTYLPVNSAGIVDPENISRALRANTLLISVMHVNNEIGTIQPIEEIARRARAAGVMFHSDGVQAAGRIPVDLSAIGVDLYSISAHKMYAPKGIGALYVRAGAAVEPLLFGGSHEQKRRAGTENVPGVVALGVACSVPQDAARLARLRDRLEAGLQERIPDITINGSKGERVPNTTNVCFEGIEGEAVVIGLDLRGFCVSSGSACSSGAVEPSHVLLALGLSREQARSSVRISLGLANDEVQVDALIEATAAVSSRLRKLSPVYVAHA